MKKNLKDKPNDTITAIATPSGRGGVGVVRVSGPKAQIIAKSILKKSLKPKTAHFGLFYTEDGSVIDQGVAIFFESPNSFTGENVLELHAHGSPIILDVLLKRIVQLGARIADPGEFSQRAFLNDKIDLIQAEAIADLISASSTQAVVSAVNSLQGEFSKKIDRLINLLIKLRSLIEASIDFTEEEIDVLSSDKIIKYITEIIKQIEQVEKTAKQGVLLREGMNVVIVGKPNAGKSSLLNCLSGRDTAIVTDIAGTTRDVLREYIHIDGMPIHIVDTAGLQESKNVIEQEGIKRTWQEVEKADEILLITDASLTKETDPQKLLPEFVEQLKHKSKLTIIKNKIDLTQKKPGIEQHDDYKVVYLSAKTHAGIDLLKKLLKDKVGFTDNTEGLFIARRRHLNTLAKAKGLLNIAKLQAEESKDIELIAENLRLAQNVLAAITGAFTTDDLLNEIFSQFCIGK
ncbi:MAG: tRNA uridine-5-carboxymethylaminomethyl(34) synthesis GTPase MnmE [Gammaproteobacteria bacterium]|jgi:tRNA modification GTPase